MFGKPEYNWVYQTQPEAQLNNRAGPFYQGKVIGGSSAVNGMTYLRGRRQDFEHWTRLDCTGWDYGSVLKAYLRSEDQRSRGASQYHAVGGPLAVSDPAQLHVVMGAFIDAAEQAGIPRNPDFNGATQEGAGYYQTMTRNGRRCWSAMAYIHPVRGRANLTVMTGAQVERVLFDGHNADGVSAIVAGERLTMRALRKVILSRVPLPLRCCCRPRVSARVRCCSNMASPYCTMRRMSAATCKTTSTRGSATVAGSRSR